MKPFKEDTLSITISTCDPTAFREQIDSVSVAAISDPEAWEAKLSIVSKCPEIETAMRDAATRFRLAEILADSTMTEEARRAIREEAERAMETTARQRLEVLAANVVKSVVRVGLARISSERLTMKFEEEQATEKELTAILDALDNPGPDPVELQLEALKNEQEAVFRVWSKCTYQENPTINERLEKLSKSGSYKGVPTGKGSHARITELEDEMIKLRGEREPRVYSDEEREQTATIRVKLRTIREFINDAAATIRDARGLIELEETRLEAAREDCEREAEKVFACLELEIRTLALIASASASADACVAAD